MKNILAEKSFDFSIRIVKLYRYLCKKEVEYPILKQLLRCGTSIGANVSEAQQAQSKLDFANKINIALKESYETDYWLRLLYATDSMKKSEYESMISDCRELEKIMISILNTTKTNLNQQ